MLSPLLREWEGGLLGRTPFIRSILQQCSFNKKCLNVWPVTHRYHDSCFFFFLPLFFFFFFYFCFFPLYFLFRFFLFFFFPILMMLWLFMKPIPLTLSGCEGQCQLFVLSKRVMPGHSNMVAMFPLEASPDQRLLPAIVWVHLRWTVSAVSSCGPPSRRI